MYIPSPQTILTAGMGLIGTFTESTSSPLYHPLPIEHMPWPNCLTNCIASKVSSGKILDFAVEKCIDSDGNQRCSKPFLVTKSTCYNIEWGTEGVISHTTAEVRDAGSGDLVYYRDTNGDWTPEKGELVYLDFKPKIAGQGNKTVKYEVETCE
jgi:hypothetical protein